MDQLSSGLGISVEHVWNSGKITSRNLNVYNSDCLTQAPSRCLVTSWTLQKVDHPNLPISPITCFRGRPNLVEISEWRGSLVTIRWLPYSHIVSAFRKHGTTIWGKLLSAPPLERGYACVPCAMTKNVLQDLRYPTTEAVNSVRNWKLRNIEKRRQRMEKYLLL